ncbi:hypothetical protein CEXT_540241, partial [Caerostris extrusa]
QPCHHQASQPGRTCGSKTESIQSRKLPTTMLMYYEESGKLLAGRDINLS